MAPLLSGDTPNSVMDKPYSMGGAKRREVGAGVDLAVGLGVATVGLADVGADETGGVLVGATVPTIGLEDVGAAESGGLFDGVSVSTIEAALEGFRVGVSDGCEVIGAIVTGELVIGAAADGTGVTGAGVTGERVIGSGVTGASEGGTTGASVTGARDGELVAWTTGAIVAGTIGDVVAGTIGAAVATTGGSVAETGARVDTTGANVARATGTWETKSAAFALCSTNTSPKQQDTSFHRRSTVNLAIFCCCCMNPEVGVTRSQENVLEARYEALASPTNSKKKVSNL